MTTLGPKDGYLMFINTFEVKPVIAARLLDVLHKTLGPISQLPGFIPTNLHISSDRSAS